MTTDEPSVAPGRPLLVAALAYAVGGLGNVAFTPHAGSQLGLLAPRFALGALVAHAWVRLTRHHPVPSLRSTARPRLVLHGAAVLEAAAITLLVLSARHTSTLTFTVIGACTPAIVALGARLLRLPQPTARAGLLATGAVLAAALVVLAAPGGPDRTTFLGIALAGASMLCGAGAVLVGVWAASVHRPPVVVRTVSLWGLAAVAVLWASGLPVQLTWSTLLAAAFIAVLPGTLAKGAVLWATARTSPALVASLTAIPVAVAGLGAWLVLDQTPTPTQVVGTAVVSACVLGLLRSLRPVADPVASVPSTPPPSPPPRPGEPGAGSGRPGIVTP